MTDTVRVPLALETAYEDLAAEVNKVVERDREMAFETKDMFDPDLGESVIHIGSFWDALSEVTGGQEELCRRAELIPTLTGPGSSYERILNAAQDKMAGPLESEARLERLAMSLSNPCRLQDRDNEIDQKARRYARQFDGNPPLGDGLCGLGSRLFPEATRNPEFLAEIKKCQEKIEQTLQDDNLMLSDVARESLKAWKNACIDIRKKANPLEVDGCRRIFLLRDASHCDPSEKTEPIPYLKNHGTGVRALEKVSAAAKAMLDWAKRARPGSGKQIETNVAESLMRWALDKGWYIGEQPETGKPGEQDGGDSQAADSTDNLVANAVDLRELEAETPTFDRDSGQWVKNKRAARLDGLEISSLCKYRSDGEQSPSRDFGRDTDGRVWRRPGTPRSHPWYLRSTLKSQP
jgi:hypothetical protein